MRNQFLKFKISFLLLAFILLALTACDIFAYPYFSVLQVSAAGERMYAYVARPFSLGAGCCGFQDPDIYSSQDGGYTWEKMEGPLKDPMKTKVETARERTAQNCEQDTPKDCWRVNGLGEIRDSSDGGDTWNEWAYHPAGNESLQQLIYQCLDYNPRCSQIDSQQCFRFTQNGEIQYSQDGGANWQVDWQIPVQRVEYLSQYYAAHHPLVPMELHVFDLAVLDSSTGIRVVVALGTHGVMVRDPQGVWAAAAIEDAQESPLQAASLAEALKIILPEFIRSAILACLMYVLLVQTAYISWRTRRKKLKWTFRYLGSIFFTLLAFGGLCFLLVQTIQENNYFKFYSSLCWTPLLLLIVVTRIVMLSDYEGKVWTHEVNVMSLLYPALIFVAFSFPYLPWAFGLIVSLSLAHVLSGVFGLLAGDFCLRLALRSANRVVEEP